jgi:hypothetical protein
MTDNCFFINIMKKINLNILCLCLLSIIFALSMSGCGNKPLFDELATNRVKVIVKGTYESNGPRPWDLSSIDPYDTSYNSTVTDPAPTRFMIDIAGLRLYSGKFKQDFANYRKTYSAPLSDTTPFFNGEGVEYKNDDMRPDFTWQQVGIFVRKMLFDSAVDFSPSGVTTWDNLNPENVEDLFREEDVDGFNFNLAQVLSYSDYLRENYLDINRIFPLKIPFEDGFVFDYDEEEVVMEIRLVVKNFIKKYEYEYVDSDKNHRLRHYYALSDWVRDVFAGEPAPTSDTMGIIGGNVLGVARYYVPNKTVTIKGTTSTTNRYVIAVNISSGHTYNEYQFASLLRPTCDTPKLPRVPILPPGGDTSIYIQELLQYYLKYEVYKQNYDNNYVACTSVANYETDYATPWNNYDESIHNFRIPPIVTYVSVSSQPTPTTFYLENVPIGATYRIYESEESSLPIPNGIQEGTLPKNYSSQLGGDIQVDESCAGKTIDIATPGTCN